MLTVSFLLARGDIFIDVVDEHLVHGDIYSDSNADGDIKAADDDNEGDEDSVVAVVHFGDGIVVDNDVVRDDDHVYIVDGGDADIDGNIDVAGDASINIKGVGDVLVMVMWMLMRICTLLLFLLMSMVILLLMSI